MIHYEGKLNKQRSGKDRRNKQMMGRNVEPRKRRSYKGEFEREERQFLDYLKRLHGYGFIDLRISGVGERRRSHLISLPDIPAHRFCILAYKSIFQTAEKH